MFGKWIVPVAVTAAVLLAGIAAPAAEETYQLTIKEHRFEPEELQIPAGMRVKLVIFNADATPEEFESHDLNREKVIPGGTKATLLIGPLKPGIYTFVGEFNEATAKGRIVVK